MHINLNNQNDHFLQLSPMIGGRDPAAPSPMLSPEPLFLMPQSQQEFADFNLENHCDQPQEDLLAPGLSEMSPQLPYPQHPDSELSGHSGQDIHHVKRQAPAQVPRRKRQQKTSKTISTKIEELPPLKFPSKELTPIRAIIQFLVQNSSQPQKELQDQGRALWGDTEELTVIFKSMLGKFQKLRKTKQEMTKYCMRKVFKFIADKMRRDRTHNRDVDSCMKIYFAKAQAGNNFSIPFKKNSSEKTMNGNFLKRVFASETFANDYRDFLHELEALMAEDNEKKIIYLAEVLQKCLKNNELKKIQSIKRLPWTREILQQTSNLAINLLSYADKKERAQDQ